MNVVNVISSLILISGTVGAQQYEGDSCRTRDGTRGSCALLPNCAIVYQQLLAGKRPDAGCGWSGFTPIVCCPSGGSAATSTTEWSRPRPTSRPATRSTTRPTLRPTPAPWATTSTPGTFSSRGPSETGALARQMCARYAKSVYTLVIPPTLAGDRRPVNASLCAIKSQKLIVGGTKAEPKEFPHMVAVGFNSGSSGIVWSCGGTLVSDRFVLTAAHCTYDLTLGSAEWVRVGDLNLRQSNDDARPQQRRVIERIRHPNYSARSSYHDIALLKMESPVEFTAWVRPACLPAVRSAQITEKAIATGWGHVEWAGETGSDHLLKVTIPIVSNRRCNTSYNGGIGNPKLTRGIVDEWQICAGQDGKDTCQGDSGGPLVVFDSSNDCMYDVIGITSVGSFCGDIIPGVYTRVYNYLSWLESIIW